jgi:predicted Zn-dependent peptidase
LFEKVREENGLCYYISSTFYSLYNAMFIQAGIDEKDLEKTIGIISKQLEIPPTEEEIKRAKRSAADSLRIIEDYPTALMDFYLTQGIFEDGVSVAEAIEKIEQVEKITLIPKISVVYLLGGEKIDG